MKDRGLGRVYKQTRACLKCHGDGCQYEADHEGGDAVPDGIAREFAHSKAAEGDKQAKHGAGVLEKHDR